MSYRFGLIVLGLLSLVAGVIEGGWWLLVAWFGANCLLLGVAHYLGAHGVYGKRRDGSLPLWSWVVFLPLIAYATAVWHLLRLFIREPAQNRIAEDLVIGRRLLPSEAVSDFDNFIDLTAEFAEPAAIRRRAGYHCFPVLDGGAPAPAVLAEMLNGLRPGKTFVHCAQGHGRSALFALAFLLKSGRARTVEEGFQILKAVRPRMHLSRKQRQCAEAFARAYCGASAKGAGGIAGDAEP